MVSTVRLDGFAFQTIACALVELKKSPPNKQKQNKTKTKQCNVSIQEKQTTINRVLEINHTFPALSEKRKIALSDGWTFNLNDRK